MALSLIRAQLKIILEGVSGMGTVHNYERYNNDVEKFLAAFVSSGKVNGCMFHREVLKKQHGMGGRVEKAHIFKIHYFRSLQDATATGVTFEDTTELISDAFDTDAAETLNDTCDTIHPNFGPMAGAAGIQMDICENRIFGNVLCHYAEMRLCAVEIIN